MSYPSTHYDRTCPACQGYGALPCGGCDGTGQAREQVEEAAAAPASASPSGINPAAAIAAGASEACPDCNGTGAIRCMVCRGKGLRGAPPATKLTDARFC